MRLRRAWTHAATAASVCAGIGLVAFDIALIRAVTPDPLPGPDRAAMIPKEEPPQAARAILPVQVVARAVSDDPFRADRRPPGKRFRMPGEPIPGAAEDSVALTRDFKLIGTAVVGSGGFAMCQAGSAAPHVVRLGQSLGGYTLTAVTRGRAVFRDGEGKPLELRVPNGGGS